jgi:hypothetical protein
MKEESEADPNPAKLQKTQTQLELEEARRNNESLKLELKTKEDLLRSAHAVAQAGQARTVEQDDHIRILEDSRLALRANIQLYEAGLQHSDEQSLGAASGSDPEDMFRHGIKDLPFKLFPLDELEPQNLMRALKWIRNHVAGNPLNHEHLEIRRLAELRCTVFQAITDTPTCTKCLNFIWGVPGTTGCEDDHRTWAGSSFATLRPIRSSSLA